MATRTIEVEDGLQEWVDNSCEELLNTILEEVKSDRSGVESDFFDNTLYQNVVCDRISEIADSNTPIYTKEIEDTFYLYSDELKEAYNNAGCYDKPPDNFEQVCICFFIEQQLHDYFRSLTSAFGEWLDSLETEFEDEELHGDSRLPKVYFNGSGDILDAGIESLSQVLKEVGTPEI